jgi:hypothetical protein
MTTRYFRTFPLNEIEQTAIQADEAEEGGRIVGFPLLKDEDDVLGIVVEPKCPPPEADRMIERIRTSLISRYGFEPALIVVLHPGQLPQSVSGSYEWQAIRLAVLLGTLGEAKAWVADGIAREHLLCPLQEDTRTAKKDEDSAFRPNTVKSIERWIRNKIHKEYSVPKLQAETARSFNEIGISSISQLQITSDIENALLIKVAPTATWETGTIGKFSEYIFHIYKKHDI